MHHFNGLVNETLGCFEQVEIIYSDGLSWGLSNLFHGFIALEDWGLFHTVSHVVIVTENVLLYFINSILYLIRHIYGNRYAGILTQILTQITQLNIPGMLPS